MAKIKVRFKGHNPNSGYGFYQAGDVGTVVGYTQGLAVVVKEDGTFVKAELSHIVKMEEDTTQELEPFFKKGTWYKCVEFIGINEFRFEKNCQYYCKYDNTLTQLRYGHNYTCIFREWDRNTCLEHFCPVTDEDAEFERMLEEFYNKGKQIPHDLDGCINKNDADKHLHKYSRILLSLARKQLQPEFDKELEFAYKNQDEVVYNRGYDKGREDERKEKVDDLISKDDIEQLVGEYQFDGHPCDFQVKAYKQGVERVVEFIKEKNV